MDVTSTVQPSAQTETKKVTPVSSPIPTFDMADLPAVLPRSMKGYELVSWKSGDDWYFTLVTGTNRQKTFEELISSENFFEKDYVKLTVQGVDGISGILERIPTGENVIWGGINLNGQVPSGTIYFSYPPQEIMDELHRVSKEHNFELITQEETE
jgi:hypothetical protein